MSSKDMQEVCLSRGYEKGGKTCKTGKNEGVWLCVCVCHKQNAKVKTLNSNDTVNEQ